MASESENLEFKLWEENNRFAIQLVLYIELGIDPNNEEEYLTWARKKWFSPSREWTKTRVEYVNDILYFRKFWI